MTYLHRRCNKTRLVQWTTRAATLSGGGNHSDGKQLLTTTAKLIQARDNFADIRVSM
jgi:hypothetical protein